MLPHTVALASFSKPGFTGPRTAKATSCLRPRHDSAPLISDGFEAQFELKLNNRESGSTKSPCADGLPFCSGPDVYSGLSAELTGNELKRESIVDGAPCCSVRRPNNSPPAAPGRPFRSRAARVWAQPRPSSAGAQAGPGSGCQVFGRDLRVTAKAKRRNLVRHSVGACDQRLPTIVVNSAASRARADAESRRFRAQLGRAMGACLLFLPPAGSNSPINLLMFPRAFSSFCAFDE